ncbi:hypothetical protein NKJ28_00275 [Mesorhizobium sp. M0145]|uniref:hypothetical protein n=1 Tax=Mesorhizobium sp. M0145 TaxID=2956895 RepID=UPI003336E9C5
MEPRCRPGALPWSLAAVQALPVLPAAVLPAAVQALPVLPAAVLPAAVLPAAVQALPCCPLPAVRLIV